MIEAALALALLLSFVVFTYFYDKQAERFRKIERELLNRIERPGMLIEEAPKEPWKPLRGSEDAPEVEWADDLREYEAVGKEASITREMARDDG